MWFLLKSVKVVHVVLVRVYFIDELILKAHSGNNNVAGVRNNVRK